MRRRLWQAAVLAVLALGPLPGSHGQIFVSTGGVSGLRMYQTNSNDWWLDPSAGRLDLRANGVLVSSVGVNGSMWVSGGITVPTPTEPNQVATKAYVDAASGGASSQQVGSLSGNLGMYANQIPSMTPPAAYTEVCFKSGSTSVDAHSVSESTAGGNCAPGDTGFVLEKAARTEANWEVAKQTCLNNGMRLPEYFELKLACKNYSAWSFTLSSTYEWGSNQFFAHWQPNSSYNVAAPILYFDGSCTVGSYSNIGHSGGGETGQKYRCAR